MPHSRVADSTIKGFIYQFNKTILEVLNSPTETVHVEGVIEDIDIYQSDSSIKAIQCKYHESSTVFNLSLIYKPIILMIKTFLNRPRDDIKFLLFLYVPGEIPRDVKLTVEQIEKILETGDQKLKKILEGLDLHNLDKQKFIEQLVVRFGCSIEDLEDEIKEKLLEFHIFKGVDAESILYPNLLTEIQRISTNKEDESRKVTREEIFQFLTRQSKAAINKWTLMTKSRKALLKTLRSDFINDLNPNSYKRCYIFQGFKYEEITKITILINTYVEKYLKKQSHKPATFIFDIEKENFDSLLLQLHEQEIDVNDGIVGGVYKENKFYKNHTCTNKGKGVYHFDFKIRAQTLKEENFILKNDFFNQTKKFGFVESEISYTEDTIVINRFEEIEYLFSFRGDI